MGKKIVVITGSPRRDGNSFAMTGAFLQAAERKSHTVTRLDAAMKHAGDIEKADGCEKAAALVDLF